LSVPSVPPKDGRSSKPSRWKLIGDKLNGIAGVIAGLVAVAAAVAGFWSFINPNSTTAQPTAVATGNPTAVHPTQERTLEQPTDSTTTPTPDLRATRAPNAPEVRNRTAPGRPVTITTGYGIDLDSTAPNWGVGQGVSGLYHPNGEVRWTKDAARIEQSGPDYGTCQQATQYYTWWKIDVLKEGDQFCIRTIGGRFSWVEIVELGSNYFRVNIVTWQLP
jgi:hypothetical protein